MTKAKHSKLSRIMTLLRVLIGWIVFQVCKWLADRVHVLNGKVVAISDQDLNGDSTCTVEFSSSTDSKSRINISLLQSRLRAVDCLYLGAEVYLTNCFMGVMCVTRLTCNKLHNNAGGIILARHMEEQEKLRNRKDARVLVITHWFHQPLEIVGLTPLTFLTQEINRPGIYFIGAGQDFSLTQEEVDARIAKGQLRKLPTPEPLAHGEALFMNYQLEVYVSKMMLGHQVSRIIDQARLVGA